MIPSIIALLLIILPTAAFASDQSRFLDHRADASWSLTEPRGQTVSVDFTTDQGTWMSVDISPDSRWLVFDLLGHIYRVASNGGEATCLTQDSGISLNFHPRISPDGQTITFVSDRAGQNNLWLMNADGSNPRILFKDPVSRITSPTWMPDGSAVVAIREFPTYAMHRRSARIWSFPVNRPSQAPKQLVGQTSGIQSYWPTISPDGEHLYYMQSTFAEPLHGMQRFQHIRRLHLKSASAELITVPEGKEWYKAEGPTELAPEISADGRWLAFARRIDGGLLEYRGHTWRSRTVLWARNLETGEERLLADPITFDMQNAHGMKNLRVLPGYAWDKKSESVVYSQGGKLRRAWLNGRSEIIPFTARVQRLASQQARSTHDISDAPFDSRYIRWPDLSPDGKVLVFEAAGWIWRKELPDGAPEMLVEKGKGPARQFMPAFSTDGSEVAFVSWDDHELGQIWRVSADGGNARQMSKKTARYLYPRWSDDGKSVIALRSTGADASAIAGGGIVRYDRVTVSRNGSETVLQASAPALVGHDGPDGRIYQLEARGGVDVQPFLAKGITPPDSHSVMVSFDPASPESRSEHLRFPTASEAAPSPGGRWVAYAEDHEVYLTGLQHVGAVYRPERPLVWEGPDTPYEVIKEDARQEIRRLSDGGGAYLRWTLDSKLVFASAGRVAIHNPESGDQQIIETGLKLPRDIPDGTIALKGARIVTLDSRGVIDNGTVVIQGSRITCVGRCDASAADRVLNLDGTTIIPGFVDVHAHGYYFAERPLIGQQIPPTSLYLAYGVTTALDPSASSAGIFPVAEMVRAGRLPGPRTYTTGENLMPQAPLTGPVDFDHAYRMVKRLADQGAISIKIYLAPRRDQRQMFAEAARQLGLSVTNEGADHTYNVGSILDGNTGFEHPMHQLPVWNDVAQFFGRTRAVYSPTLVVAGAGTWMEDYYQSRANLWNNPKLRHFLPWRRLQRLVNHAKRPITEYTHSAMAEAVADIIRAGGFGAIGGHGQTFGLDSHWEVWGYAEALKPLEALEMASLGGAQMAGLEDDLGSIAVGKLADLMVLDANPLEDIQNTAAIRYVMKGGVLYDDDTLSEVWPDPMDRPAPAWVRNDIFKTDTKSIEQ